MGEGPEGRRTITARACRAVVGGGTFMLLLCLYLGRRVGHSRRVIQVNGFWILDFGGQEAGWRRDSSSRFPATLRLRLPEFRYKQTPHNSFHKVLGTFTGGFLSGEGAVSPAFDPGIKVCMRVRSCCPPSLAQTSPGHFRRSYPCAGAFSDR